MIKQLEKILMPLAEAIGRNKYLVSIRDGFLVSTPLLIAGSIFLLIANFPIPAWTEWLSSVVINSNTGETLAAFIEKPSGATFTIMAVFAVVGIAYSFARQMKTDKIFGAAVAIMGWFLIMPYTVEGTVEMAGKEIPVSLTGIPTGWVGAKGIFVGIICAFVAVHIYSWVEKKGWVIKMPAGVPDVVSKSFSALIPGITILAFFGMVLKVIEITGLGSLNAILAVVIGKPLGLIAGTLPGTFVAVFLNSLLWFCGVNGGQVVGAVMNPLWIQYADANRIAQMAGEALPNIVTAPFMDLFVYIGGGGATIGLALCLMFFSKSKAYKTLGKVSGIPALFNINTAILFTFPTVLNPIMLIPFVLTPVVNAIITYLAMMTNLVPYTTGVTLPWTTPPIIGGFLATGSWRGAVLQIVLVAVSFMIYFPFFKAADKRNLEKESVKKEGADK